MNVEIQKELKRLAVSIKEINAYISSILADLQDIVEADDIELEDLYIVETNFTNIMRKAEESANRTRSITDLFD